MAAPAATPPPTGGDNKHLPRPVFKVVNTTQQEEDAYDYVSERTQVKKIGITGAVAHMVKGALGAGILGGHVAYMQAGYMVAIPLNVGFGFYMGFCLHLLVKSTQILYKRTRIPLMSYADAGEAAFCCFQDGKWKRLARPFRYCIDAVICLDLFGSCAAYQLIIAKSIKQLVENVHDTSSVGPPGYPDLKTYLAILIIPVILICLITHLKWLAPFSLAANMVILISIFTAVHYAIKFNPGFTGMVTHTHVYQYLRFIGVIVFSMSCAGVVIPVENTMRIPRRFPIACAIGMTLVVLSTFLVSFFGYVAFLDKCEPPITVNFPMEFLPKILKGLIAVMIYVTHALNFWVPFNLVFTYLKRLHSPNKELKWELIYRAIIVLLIGIVAIVFPDINAIMGFLGTFCLTNMAFIWPNLIYLLVVWDRPGLGKYKWRLWRSLLFIIVGIFVWICGSMVTIYDLIKVFTIHNT